MDFSSRFMGKSMIMEELILLNHRDDSDGVYEMMVIVVGECGLGYLGRL